MACAQIIDQIKRQRDYATGTKAGACLTCITIISGIAMITILSATIAGTLPASKFGYATMITAGVVLLTDATKQKLLNPEERTISMFIFTSLITVSLYMVLPALTINGIIPAQLLSKILLGVSFAPPALLLATSMLGCLCVPCLVLGAAFIPHPKTAEDQQAANLAKVLHGEAVRTPPGSGDDED